MMGFDEKALLNRMLSKLYGHAVTSHDVLSKVNDVVDNLTDSLWIYLHRTLVMMCKFSSLPPMVANDQIVVKIEHRSNVLVFNFASDREYISLEIDQQGWVKYNYYHTPSAQWGYEASNGYRVTAKLVFAVVDYLQRLDGGMWVDDIKRVQQMLCSSEAPDYKPWPEWARQEIPVVYYSNTSKDSYSRIKVNLAQRTLKELPMVPGVSILEAYRDQLCSGDLAETTLWVDVTPQSKKLGGLVLRSSIDKEFLENIQHGDYRSVTF